MLLNDTPVNEAPVNDIDQPYDILYPKVLSESTDLYDARKVLSWNILATDVQTLVDAFSKSVITGGGGPVTTKVMSDTLNTLDGLYRIFLHGYEEETLDVTDDPNRTIILQLNDLGIDITDEQARKIVRGRVGTDNIVLSDGFISWRRLRRTMDESLTLLDQFSKLVAGAGTTYTRVLSEAIEFSDGYLRYLRYRRTTDDTLTILDAFSKLVSSGAITYSRTLEDSMALFDSTTKYLRYGRTAEDSVSTLDGFIDYVRYRRTVGDTLDIIDAFSKLISGAGITYTKIMGDSVTMIDDTGNRWTFRRNQMTDALSLTDSMVYGAVRGRVLQDTVAFTDGLTKWLRLLRQFGDDLEFSDGTVRVRRLNRAFGDTLDLTDEMIRSIALFEPSTTDFRIGVGVEPFRFGIGPVSSSFGVH